MGTRDDWRITLLPVETTIPFPEKEKEEEEDDATKDARKNRGGQSREEIYNNVWKQAQTDRNYLVFVVCSPRSSRPSA